MCVCVCVCLLEIVSLPVRFYVLALETTLIIRCKCASLHEVERKKSHPPDKPTPSCCPHGENWVKKKWYPARSAAPKAKLASPCPCVSSPG